MLSRTYPAIDKSASSYRKLRAVKMSTQTSPENWTRREFKIDTRRFKVRMTINIVHRVVNGGSVEIINWCKCLERWAKRGNFWNVINERRKKPRVAAKKKRSVLDARWCPCILLFAPVMSNSEKEAYVVVETTRKRVRSKEASLDYRNG